jgi:hypothetical protein
VLVLVCVGTTFRSDTLPVDVQNLPDSVCLLYTSFEEAEGVIRK